MPSSFASSIEQLIGGIFKFFVDFASQNAPFISRIFGSTIIIIKTIGIMTPVKMTIAQTTLVFLKNGPFPSSFSLFLSFQYTVDSKQIFNKYIYFCQWLDSNRGPLVLEATALPTEPQPLPNTLGTLSNHSHLVRTHLLTPLPLLWPLNLTSSTSD